MKNKINVKYLRHGIKIMKWRRKSGYFIFASSKGVVGRIILYSRGYRIHKTMLGNVLMKNKLNF